MASIGDTWFDFFKDEDIKKELRELLYPVAGMVYNELYVYIWSICFFHLFLFIILTINLILLIRLTSKCRDIGLFTIENL